jgi:transcriptional regulator with XRE-family HTH domain
MTQIIQRERLPTELSELLLRLGDRVAIARKRRGLTMDALAAKMFVSRKTLHRLEHGDPGVSLGVFSTALWILGLLDDFASIADPEADVVGIYNERKRLPKRIRSDAKNDGLDF